MSWKRALTGNGFRLLSHPSVNVCYVKADLSHTVTNFPQENYELFSFARHPQCHAEAIFPHVVSKSYIYPDAIKRQPSAFWSEPTPTKTDLLPDLRSRRNVWALVTWFLKGHWKLVTVNEWEAQSNSTNPLCFHYVQRLLLNHKLVAVFLLSQTLFKLSWLVRHI